MNFKLIAIIILVIALFTSSCSLSASNNDKNEFMKRVPFPKSTNILHAESYKGGTIFFYEDKSGFRADFYSKKDNYLVDGGNGEINPKSGFDWIMRNDPNIALVLFAGVITDDKIKKVIVKQKTLEQNAKIINTDEGKRIWFATFDVIEGGHPDPLKIEAFDKEGNIYWKDGIYGGSLFQGRTNQ